MRYALGLALWLSVALAVGAEQEGAEIRVKALVGHRDTRFWIRNSGGKITLEMVMEAQYSRTRELKEREWNFIVSEFERLPVPRKIPPECERFRMDVVFSAGGKEQSKASCIGFKTVTSPAYARFAQLLALAFER